MITCDHLEYFDFAADHQRRAYALVREQYAFQRSPMHSNNFLSTPLVTGYGPITPPLQFDGAPNLVTMPKDSQGEPIAELDGSCQDISLRLLALPLTPCRTTALSPLNCSAWTFVTTCRTLTPTVESWPPAAKPASIHTTQPTFPDSFMLDYYGGPQQIGPSIVSKDRKAYRFFVCTVCSI